MDAKFAEASTPGPQRRLVNWRVMSSHVRKNESHLLSGNETAVLNNLDSLSRAAQAWIVSALASGKPVFLVRFGESERLQAKASRWYTPPPPELPDLEEGVLAEMTTSQLVLHVVTLPRLLPVFLYFLPT